MDTQQVKCALILVLFSSIKFRQSTSEEMIFLLQEIWDDIKGYHTSIASSRCMLYIFS